jgi:hypothetical protein
MSINGTDMKEIKAKQAEFSKYTSDLEKAGKCFYSGL